MPHPCPLVAFVSLYQYILESSGNLEKNYQLIAWIPPQADSIEIFQSEI